jgi:hypothetical protein
MVVCLVGQISIVAKNDFFIYYLDWNVGEKFRENYLDKEQEDFDYGLIPKTPPTLNKILSSSSMSPNGTMQASQAQSPYSSKSISSVRSVARYPPEETISTYLKAARRNFAKTDGLLYALLFVFIVTFTVFPGVTYHTYLTFLLPLDNDVGWFNLFMATVFNVMDTVGRKMGGVK